MINSYTSGWVAADKIPDPVTPGFIPWLIKADEHFRVAIFSSRSHQPGGRVAMQAYIWAAMGDHFDLHGHPGEHHVAYALMGRLEFPTEKPPALITIDDRAMTFTGNWDDFDPVALLSFRPWNKLPAGVKVPPPSLPTAEERAWVPIMAGVAIALVVTVLFELWRAG